MSLVVFVLSGICVSLGFSLSAFYGSSVALFLCGCGFFGGMAGMKHGGRLDCWDINLPRRGANGWAVQGIRKHDYQTEEQGK
jgi:hypothetical protein